MDQYSAITPLVSFCTQTYNSERWIIDLLDCAKNQTYPHLELIISDDCSTDNTVQLIRDWIADNGDRFSRCVLVSTPHNMGYAGNKANAERQCKGVYIKSIDSDDWIDDTFIEKAVRILEERKDCAFLYTDSITVFPDKRVKESYQVDGNAFPALFMVEFWPDTPAWFYRREVMETSFYRPEMFLSEDYLRLLEIAHKYRFYHLDEYLAYYRRDYEKKELNEFRWWQSQLMAINHFKGYELYPVRHAQIRAGLYFCVVEKNQPRLFMKLAFQFKDVAFVHDYYLFYKRKMKSFVKANLSHK